MTLSDLYYLVTVIGGVVGGGITVLALSRTNLVSLQDKAIQARDKRIADLETEVRRMGEEHTAEMSVLQEELADLHKRLQQLVAESVEKDQTILLLLRKAKAQEDQIRRTDQLRGSCAYRDQCPLERRGKRATGARKVNRP